MSSLAPTLKACLTVTEKEKLIFKNSCSNLFGEKGVRKLFVSTLPVLLIFAALFNLAFVFSSNHQAQSAFLKSESLNHQTSDSVSLPTTQSINYNFSRYHTIAETVTILQNFQKAYPNLLKTYTIGSSFKGKQIWAVEMTNFLNGLPFTKPAMLYVGPHHGNEIIGKEIALYYMWYLLSNYGANETVTRILNEKTIYVIPCVNVDGNDWSVSGLPQRFNCRPMDDDGDGLLDEDPPEDLNGDGKITDMRFWNETKNDWDYYPEGLDKDGDGFCTNEGWAKADSIGGIDLNRNYPKGWTDYPGHGEYPFSEPETQAVRDFVASHPNIATVFDTHSGALCIVHPWTYTGTSTPDNQLYITLRNKYENLTGYAYHRMGAQGTSIDWIYDTQSAIAFSMELFGGGFYPGGYTQFEKDYPDINVPWQNFSHPQLGNVQIGGTWIIRAYNPPEAEIERWALKNLPMLIDLAEITSKLEITGFNVSRGEGGIFNISTTITNLGFLDTATYQALQTQTNKPVNVTLSFSSNIELASKNQTLSFAVIKGNQTVSSQWQIRIKQSGYTWVKVSVTSSKGGVDEIYARFYIPSREPLHVIP